MKARYNLYIKIIESLDVAMCTVLTSLDLSAAFDTVDNAIFLRRANNNNNNNNNNSL